MGFEIIAIDVRNMLSELRPHHFGPLFFWLLWLCVLFASLRGVDRRDEIAQVTYMAFVAAFGVLFVMVLSPGKAKDFEPQDQIILFVLFLIVPSIRWIMRRKMTDLEKRMRDAVRNKSTTK